MNRFRHTLPLVILFAAPVLYADEPTSADLEFFEKKIRPVLVSHCYSCHSAEATSVKGGLLLDTREGTRQGGESGHAVVPGNLEDSLLIRAVKFDGLEMPPKKQLPENVIADLEKWVRMGAPDPREGISAPVRQTIDIERSREFWAFQPITKPIPPQPKDQEWAAAEIDRFVLAKLEAAGLRPAPDAEPRVLIRRLYFDLIGLPPTPEQISEYSQNPTQVVFLRIADRLLASNQFGERWGRHWLDVVRYAESTGMERNYTYPQAWRYRDYVIDSFNSDKPFDRFLTEQVAGDLLEYDNQHDRDDNLVATGMLAIGPKSLNENNKEVFAMDVVDEQIDVVSRAFLGLTASCARCHDHKFDPIPQAEYYQLAGIFRSTDTFYGTGGGGGNRQPGRLLALRENEVVAVNVAGGDKGNKNQKKLTAQLKQQQKKLEQLVAKKAAEKQVRQVKDAIAKLKKQLQPASPDEGARDENDVLVMAVRDAAKPSDTQIRLRGEANERGSSVPRGFLSIATLTDSPHSIKKQSGRKELAAWLTEPGNPLTARVAANRIWQHLFGQGIVGTVNNFGANGDRPSHPELLDYLADELRTDGWSMKSLIRSIIASRTYQQSSAPNAVAADADPENRLLWRMNPRRLEAESLRDAMLAVSGTLDLSPGEKSVVTKVGDGDIGRNLKTNQFATNEARRSVYLPIVRGVVPEMLQIFDFPEPSIIADARDVTTVPTQGLFMMNSPFVLGQSRKLADRLLTEKDNDTDRIQFGYQVALGRPASAVEVERSLLFIDQAGQAGNEKKQQASKQEAWAGFCQVLLASAEFRYLE